jgi:hypothetical protein
MHRRTYWSNTIDAEDIPTPVHARNAWSSVRSLRKDKDVKNEEHRTPTMNDVNTTNKSRNTRIVQYSVLVSLIFIFFLIAFAYDNEHFIPVTTVGSMGAFVVALIIFNDQIPHLPTSKCH